VVLATEKKLPSILVDETTVQKISLLTPNVGMTYSGMGPDSRLLVRRARKSGQVYYRQYHEQTPVAQLCRETAAVMQEFTRKLRQLMSSGCPLEMLWTLRTEALA
jgi:20S proteasome subunit alpha 2